MGVIVALKKIDKVISEEDINRCLIPSMNKTKRHFKPEFKAKVAMAALKEEMAYSLFFDKKVISIKITFSRISGSSQPELPYFGIALWRKGHDI